MDFFLNRFMPRLCSHQLWHADWAPESIGKVNKKKEDDEKKRISKLCYEKLGFDPSTPNKLPTGRPPCSITKPSFDALMYIFPVIRTNVRITGNMFKIFQRSKSREELAKMLPEQYRREFVQLHLEICTILKILVSQHHDINVHMLKSLCTTAYLRFLREFKWVKLSPTLHRILAHGWESVSENGGRGLGNQGGNSIGLFDHPKLGFRELKIHRGKIEIGILLPKIING